MNTLLEFLNTQMRQPNPWGSLKSGWFHYISLALMVIGMVIVVIRFKQISEEKLKKTLVVYACVLLIFEVYKQVIFTYQASAYQWYAFPFQFCSTPMYVSLVAGLTKNNKLRTYLISFLATFGFFAGLAVMLYPETVFVRTLGINMQTMIHHGGMAIMGFGLLAHQVKLESKTILKASLVFTCLVGIAMVMNLIHNTWIQEGTFNMFFINHLYENGIPVLSLFQPLVPHIVFLMIYIFGFSLVAYIILMVRIGISKLSLNAKVLVKKHS
jgi:hypothetical protein